MKHPPEMESPDEAASARFYASLEDAPTGALVISDMSGHNFWVSCGLCLGDEVRKAPRRYRDKGEAQREADAHMATWHKGANGG